MTTITLESRGAAGNASKIAVQAFNRNEIITAVRTKSGNLKLICWRVADDFIRAESEEAGAVSEIAMSILGRRVVTAVRDGSKNLKLITWEVPPGLGSVTRLKDSEDDAGDADLITMTPVADSLLVTAVRTASGNLKLITWKLRNDGRPMRIFDSKDQAGEVDLVAATSLSHPFGNTFITAVRTAGGNLKLITWNISRDGELIERLADSADKAGAVGEIAMSRVGSDLKNDGINVVTAVQTSKDTLKVIKWIMDRNGSFIGRGVDSDDLAVGEISKIAIAKTGIKPTYMTSMRRNGDHNLRLIAFEEAPRNMIPTGQFEQDERGTSETNLLDLGEGRVVSANRKGNFLHLYAWRITEGPIGPTLQQTVTTSGEANNPAISG